MRRKAGYQWPETQGPRLLKNAKFPSRRCSNETAAISADEVLARLADTATSDLMDFIEVDRTGEWKVDLKRIKRLGLGHWSSDCAKQGRISDIELEPRTTP